MKKLLSLVLVLALAVSMTGCGSKEKDPAAMYAEAVEKTNKLESMEVEADIDISMEMMGMTMDIGTSMNMKGIDLQKDTAKLAMEMDMSMLGQSITMEMYYADGYQYTNAMGEKVKTATPLADMMEQVEGSAGTETIPADAFKEITAAKDGDNTVLTYVADGAKMTEQIKGAMSALSEMEAEMGEMDITVGDVEGTVTINKDGYIANQTMTVSMTMAMGEVEGTNIGDVTMGMTMDASYINPGQSVTVTLPGDLDSYTEVAQ